MKRRFSIAHVIILAVFILVMVVPTLNKGKQLLHDERYRERDRIAVQYATDINFWTAYYVGLEKWIATEGKK